MAAAPSLARHAAVAGLARDEWAATDDAMRSSIGTVRRNVYKYRDEFSHREQEDNVCGQRSDPPPSNTSARRQPGLSFVATGGDRCPWPRLRDRSGRRQTMHPLPSCDSGSGIRHTLCTIVSLCAPAKKRDTFPNHCVRMHRRPARSRRAGHANIEFRGRLWLAWWLCIGSSLSAAAPASLQLFSAGHLL